MFTPPPPSLPEKAIYHASLNIRHPAYHVTTHSHISHITVQTSYPQPVSPVPHGRWQFAEQAVG